MSKVLAINGGDPVLREPLRAFPNSLGRQEREAALRVLNSGILSDFVARDNEHFLGGKEVRGLEKDFSDKFGARFAVSFNSATTALHAALVALKIGPGDEVIVPPYTMSATPAAVLLAGATPVFADISEKNFCLDPDAVRQKITPKTKAIVVVNLFGGPADFDGILDIAKKNNLKVIEDNAQAPGAKYQNKYCGTIGDIGVFSLNVHKVIQSGEGGVLLIQNPEYARRARLVRNHGEALGEDILGSNYKMTELQAAVAREQLKKLDFLNEKARELADYLTMKLKNIRGLEMPIFNQDIHHVFYVYPIKVKPEFGIPRDKLADAMTAEGFFMHKGYVQPLYHLPLFQKYQTNCPVVERLYKTELTYTTVCKHPNTKRHIDLFLEALNKILEHREELT